MALPRRYKETSVFKEDAIGDGIDAAAKSATDYLTVVDDTGLMVHPSGDQTSGWKISSALELLKSGITAFKVWLENGVAKVRIGVQSSPHVDITPDGVTMMQDASRDVATFKANEYHSYIWFDGDGNKNIDACWSGWIEEGLVEERIEITASGLSNHRGAKAHIKAIGEDLQGSQSSGEATAYHDEVKLLVSNNSDFTTMSFHVFKTYAALYFPDGNNMQFRSDGIYLNGTKIA